MVVSTRISSVTSVDSGVHISISRNNTVYTSVSQRYSLPSFDNTPFHCNWPMYAVKFIIQAAGIANSIAAFVTTPEWSGVCAAVSTDKCLPIYLMLVISGAAITR